MARDVTFASLTPREKEILRAYPAHGDHQGIADELGLKIQTVKNHVTDILRKLQCVSLGQAAVTWDRTQRQTWPETDRRGWQRRGPQRRVGERRAVVIEGYVNPDGSGRGHWSREQTG